MLSRIQWTFFLKPEHFEPNRFSLVSSIKRYVTIEYPVTSASTGEFNMLSGHLAAIRSNSNNSPPAEPEAQPEPEDDQQQPSDVGNQRRFAGDFWVRHFGSRAEVSFATFKEKFNGDYSDRITSNFGADKKKLFENLMYKDIFLLKQVASRSRYNLFTGKPAGACGGGGGGKASPGAATRDGRGGGGAAEPEEKEKAQCEVDPDAFYGRLEMYVSCSLATRKVLGMESTVRMTAIQQLGKPALK